MDKIYKLSDSIKLGKNKKAKVSELVETKSEIFNLIKNGYQFDDEVLEKAHIKKKISNVKVITEFVTTPNNKKQKELPKDKESFKNIIKSINTLENGDMDDNLSFIPEEEEINVYDFIEED